MLSQVKLDAVFLRSNNFSFFATDSEADISQAILFQISRKPADLILHQQRIQQHIDNNQADQLFVALVDLNIVLKDRGAGFRTNMLNKSKLVMSKIQFKFLQNHLANGLDATDPIGGLDGSVLHSGIRGRTQFAVV